MTDIIYQKTKKSDFRKFLTLLSALKEVIFSEAKIYYANWEISFVKKELVYSGKHFVHKNDLEAYISYFSSFT